MESRQIFVAYLILGCCLVGSALGQTQPPRLGIVPATPELSAPGDLLTANLSARADLALVERAQIEQIQREQQLTAGDVKAGVKLGEQLGADGLLSLSVRRDNLTTNLAVQLIAVKPGVVLRTLDYPWPLPDPTSWAQTAARQFAPLFPKLGVLPKDAIPVSVLNLRSAAKSAMGEQWEKDLTLLLINRLSREREVFVLERKRLATLEAEKELKGMEQSSFWNGSYLIEGTVDPEGVNPQTVQIRGRLVPPMGRAPETFDVSGPRTNLPVVADRMAVELLARLRQGGGSTTNAWDPRAEAERYLGEAGWAMRWKVYPQARQAADAAWALGRHDLGTACLKVQSYFSGSGVNTGIGFDSYSMTLHVGGVFPEHLETLTVALENVANLTPLIGTNAMSPQWEEAVIGAISSGGHHLWRYWFTPEAQAGVEGQLARLREAIRNAESVMLGGAEPGVKIYQSSFGQRLWNTKLSLGWQWAENPESILAEYRRLFQEGLTTKQRQQFLFRNPEGRSWNQFGFFDQNNAVISSPLLVAWNGTERTAIPHLWRNFVREMQSSTNFVNALIVGLLNHQTLPRGELVDGPEGGYNRSAQPICDLIWQHREELFCREPVLLADALLILSRHEEPRRPPPSGTYTNALQNLRTNLFPLFIDRENCFSPELAQRLFVPSDYQTNHLTALLQRIGARDNPPTKGPPGRVQIFRAYLFSGNRFHEETFRYLCRPQDYSGEEISEILNRMKWLRPVFNPAPPSLSRSIDEFERLLAGVPASKPVERSRTSVLQTNRVRLLANNIWKAPVLRSPTQYETGVEIYRAIYRQNRLWLEGPRTLHTMVKTGFDQYADHSTNQNVIWDVDLTSWQTKSNAFRRGNREAVQFNPPRTFEVLNGTIYRVGGDKLLAKPLDQEDWRELDVPLSGFVTPAIVAGRLYLGSSEALIEVDPGSLATRILASKRRQAVENDAERLIDFEKPQFSFGNEDTILVFLGNSIQPWNRTTSKWGSPLPQKPADRRLTDGDPRMTYADASQMFFTSLESNDEVQRFWRLANGRAAEELFPPRVSTARFGPTPWKTPSSRNAVPSNPKWQCPESIDPSAMLRAPEGENLWCLSMDPQRAEGMQVYFDDRWTEPLQFSLQVNPLFAIPCQSVWGLGVFLQVIATPEGLVIFPGRCPAFWFIPRADLDKAIAAAAAQNPPRLRAKRMLPPFVVAAPPVPVMSKDGVDCTVVVLRFDQDNDGSLNWNELLQAIQSHEALAKLKAPRGSGYSSLFYIQPYDINQNQKLEPAELATLLDNPEPRKLPASLKAYDSNGDGQLDGDEVRAIQKQRQK